MAYDYGFYFNIDYGFYFNIDYGFYFNYENLKIKNMANKKTARIELGSVIISISNNQINDRMIDNCYNGIGNR